MDMRHLIVLLVVLSIALLAGCKKGDVATKSYSDPIGTYEGQGKLTLPAGSMKVNATLALKPDGTYLFSIRELGALGNEIGRWQKQGDTLTTQPDSKMWTQGQESNRGAQLMDAMSSNQKSRQYTLASGFSSVSFNDGTMQIEMKRTL